VPKITKIELDLTKLLQNKMVQFFDSQWIHIMPFRGRHISFRSAINSTQLCCDTLAAEQLDC